MKQTNPLREGVMYGGIYLVLLCLIAFVPGIGILGTIILPLPFLLFAARWDIRISFAFSFLVIALSLLVLYPALPMVMVAVTGGLALGIALKQDKSPYEAWAQGAAGFVVGILLFYVLSLWLFQVNWITQFNQYMTESMETSRQMLESISGTISEERVQLLEEQANQLSLLLPSFMGIFSIVIAFLTLWIGFKVHNKVYKTSYAFPPVRELTLPKVLLWYHLIAVIATWINAESGTMLYEATQNIYTLTGFFMTLQGITFIFAYAHAKKLPKIFSIIGVIVGATLLVYPIMILGIIDLGFSLRERIKKN
ncbi:YybS family protein [Pontibacillus salicampi]|uniref:YybS family protein n=1 Tax=Pontibacillus salicampi TaxID=1449801 RepID=A0ABV6LU91_9BACI